MIVARCLVRLPARLRPLASRRLLAVLAAVVLGAALVPTAPPARAQVGPPEAYVHLGGALGGVLLTEDQILVTRGPRVVAFEREPAGIGAEVGASERLSGPPLTMVRHGDRLLVSTIGASLDVLDLVPSGPPLLRHRVALPETTSGLAVDGDRAYLVGNHWLAILDLALDAPAAERVPLDAASSGELDDLPYGRRLVVAGGRLVFSGSGRRPFPSRLHVAEILPGPRVRTVATLPIGVVDLVAIGARVFAIDHSFLETIQDAVVAVHVAPGAAPRELGRWSEDASTRRAYLHDLFVADGRLGVVSRDATHFLDVVPSAPRLVARGDRRQLPWCPSSYGQPVAQRDGLLATACPDILRAAAIADDDPANPTWVAEVPTGDAIFDVAIGDGMVAVVRGRDVQVLALDGSGGVREVATTTVSPFPRSAAIGGGRLWIVGYGELRVATLGTDPLDPQPVALGDDVREVVVVATQAGAVAASGERLLVVDATVGAPRVVAELDPDLGPIDELVAHGSRVYAGSGEGFAIVDIADPAMPTVLAVARHDSSRWLETDGRTAWRYDGLDLLAFDVSDPSRGLPVTRYRAPYPISGLALRDGALLAVHQAGFLAAVTAFDATTPGILRPGPTLRLPLFHGLVSALRVEGDAMIAASQRDGLIVAPAPFAAPWHGVFVPVAHRADG